MAPGAKLELDRPAFSYFSSVVRTRHPSQNRTRHALDTGNYVYDLEERSLRSGANASHALKAAQFSRRLDRSALGFYWSMYRLYCVPNPKPFPVFDRDYLESIDLEVLNAFRPYLLRWYRDTANKATTNIHVRADEIIVQLFDENLKSYSANLASITPEQVDLILYLDYPFEPETFENVAKRPSFTTVCGPIVESKFWGPWDDAITHDDVYCYTDRAFTFHIPQSSPDLLERYDDAYWECDRVFVTS